MLNTGTYINTKTAVVVLTDGAANQRPTTSPALAILKKLNKLFRPSMYPPKSRFPMSTRLLLEMNALPQLVPDRSMVSKNSKLKVDSSKLLMTCNSNVTPKVNASVRMN
jgi:hypothetical protein